MKIIVTIPAFNEAANITEVITEIPRRINGVDKVEVLVIDDGSTDRTVELAKQAGADYVLLNGVNKGLAYTFQRLIEEALQRGADIVVNTDGDNHYNQSRISELVAPILEKRADIVIGDREVKKLEHMPAANKYFNLIQALDHNLAIAQVPIRARKVTRKSRLISNIPKHLVKSLIVIFRVFTIYKPLRVLSTLGLCVFLPGFILVLRFLYFYFFTARGGEGHIQSLIIAAIFILLGFQIFILGLIASAIGWNRKMSEEILYRIKKESLKE